MAITPSPPDDPDGHARRIAGPADRARLDPGTQPGEAAGRQHWQLELLEPALIARGIPYGVTDCEAAEAEVTDIPHPAPKGWIDFWMPTRVYQADRGPHRCGEGRVLVRLTVEAGRLSITAPAVYPRGSLGAATDHAADAATGHGTLRIIHPRTGDRPRAHLVIATDGEVTAVLDAEWLATRLRHRRQLMAVVTDFVAGIDELECAIDHVGLWRS